MRLLELQLRRVLASDDALVRIDIAGQAIQQRRFPGAGTAGDKDIAPNSTDDPKDFRPSPRDRAVLDQLVEGKFVFLEFSDCQRSAIDSKGRHNDIDARAVWKPSVADWRGFVDAPADLAHDPLAYVQELGMVTEANVRLANPALHLDKNVSIAIDHDVRDIIAGKKRFQRAVTKNVIAHILDEILHLRELHRRLFRNDDLIDHVADFCARFSLVHFCYLDEIDDFN